MVIVAVPVIKLDRKVANSCIAARLDIGKRAFHDAAHFVIGGFDDPRIDTLFQNLRHAFPPLTLLPIHIRPPIN